jgi:hypothetical protein
MATAAKNVVESLRDVVQDILVPEFKALKASGDALRVDMHELRFDLKESVDSLRQEMRLRDQKMEQLVRSGDEKNEQAIRSLSEKLDYAIEIRERLASLEARMPRQ